MKLPELKSLMKENKIKGSSYMNRPEIIAVLLDRGIISEDSLNKQDALVKREIDPKYEFIRSIRNNPKSVDIRNLETGKMTTYSYMKSLLSCFLSSTISVLEVSSFIYKKKIIFLYQNFILQKNNTSGVDPSVIGLKHGSTYII